MKRWLFLCLALLCGVRGLCATESDVATRTEGSDEPESPKPASLKGEMSDKPLTVESGAWKLTFSGYAQASYLFDCNYLYNSGDVNSYSYGGKSNGFTVDRLMLITDAQLNGKLRLHLMLDARGMSLHEMYGEYTFAKGIRLRAGLFKQPFMLENLISPTRLNNLQINPTGRFMTGMSLDDVMGKTAGRDIGIMLTGELFACTDRQLVNYSVGLFNGNFRGDHNKGFKDNNTQKDFVCMINLLATKQLMFTTSCVMGTGHALVDRPGVCAKDEDYSRRRFCAGFEWTGKPLYLRSEYVHGIDNHRTHSNGAYISADVHLSKQFDLVLNYDYLDTGNRSATLHSTYMNNRTHTLIAGVAYRIYKQCRVLTEYSYAKPQFGKEGHLWQTQLQLVF